LKATPPVTRPSSSAWSSSGVLERLVELWRDLEGDLGPAEDPVQQAPLRRGADVARGEKVDVDQLGGELGRCRGSTLKLSAELLDEGVAALVGLPDETPVEVGDVVGSPDGAAGREEGVVLP
jgi:hypothetical protein